MQQCFCRAEDLYFGPKYTKNITGTLLCIYFLYFCHKIPTRDPCDQRDMRDMHFDSRNKWPQDPLGMLEMLR